jgi:alpha-L-fucosidase 2
VFRYTSEGPDWWDGNTLGIQHIYPGNAIHPDSNPRLLEIGLNTVMEMNRWHDGNGSNSFFPAAVRVGADPQLVLEQLRRYVENTWPNGFMRDNPHGIENCSTVHNTINEMLCMSAGHVLRLFPVWPKEKDAAFVNLRAWGAFLVSAEQKNGIVGGVRIVSERGRPCVLQNPWPGRSVAVTRNGRKAETLSGERFTVATTADEILTFAPVVP